MDLTFFILGALLILAALAALASAWRTRVEPPEPDVDPSPTADPLGGRYDPFGERQRQQERRDRADTRREAARVRRAGGFAAAGILLSLGLGTVLLDSFTIVAARSVAVQTAFGKVQGEPLTSGWHWVAPWNSVEKFDASVQTLKFYKGGTESDGKPKDGYDGTCVTVRLANNTNACVDVTTQWAINHDPAAGADVNELYLKYKTFDNIHDNLVTRQLQSALNEVFGGYDPLAALGTDAADPAAKPTVNTKDLQGKVKTALIADLGGFITVDSVTIPLVHFDADTEGRLKAFQAAKADTRIAQQTKLTATEQAAAAEKLAAKAGALDKPGVRYQNCLNLIGDLAKRDQLKNLPTTFNCAEGGSPPLLLGVK